MSGQNEHLQASVSSLVGVWRLVSFGYEDQVTGKRENRFGTMPKGRLMLLENGLMTVILTAEGRPIPKTNEDRASHSPHEEQPAEVIRVIRVFWQLSIPVREFEGCHFYLPKDEP